MEELIGEINIEELAEFRARFNKPQRVRESIFTGWTQDAYNCWKSKADCEHCTINTCYHMKYYCRMPESVQVLLDTIGEPTTDVFREGSMDE